VIKIALQEIAAALAIGAFILAIAVWAIALYP